MRRHRFIVSGGGTGGHIFPAIAIADGIKSQFPDSEILFVGAEGKMEMERVPQAGYKIKGLKVTGLKRSLTWKNLLFPFKLTTSLMQARRILQDFHPDAVIGVGGYASAPTVAMASLMNIPTLIQEQNSYAGLTNKWLARRVDRICVAYEGMEKFFDPKKLVLTGNPVRKNLLEIPDRKEALKHFGLQDDKKTILIFGGSLGAKTLNLAMAKEVEKIRRAGDVQFLWQIGSFYRSEFMNVETTELANVIPLVFIDRMDLAYACADLVICRAGALTVSELCVLGKASILVPSPNVAEDHQTANARSLVIQGAAEMIGDNVAAEALIDQALDMIHDEDRLENLRRNSYRLGKPNATEDIVKEIFKILK